MAHQVEKFAQFCAEQGRPELLELLPEISEGARVEIRVEGARCSRPLDDDDATVLATGLVVSGLDVSVVSLPNHAIGNPGAAALSTLLLEEPATGYAGALNRLDLRGNAVGAVGVQAIADAVRKSTAIVDLDLSWNPLGEEGGYRVAEMLESLETLKALKVAHTDLDTSALIAICSTLRTNGACLEHLDVGGAVLAAEQSEDFAKHVATMLGLNRRLLSLSLGNCRIGDDSVGHIATALQGNPTLTALNLKANRGRSAGAAALADALRRSALSAGNRRGALAPPLKILDLSHNAIGDEGAAALADAVAHECSLYELRVAHNDIDDAGLADLARALHHPNHPRYVAAWGNRFGKSANAEFHDLYHGDNDCYVEMDFTTYEVDGKLRAAERVDLAFTGAKREAQVLERARSMN